MSHCDHFADSPPTTVGGWISRRSNRRQLALIQPFLPDRNSAVLEIGPGRGELAELFLQAGYRNYTVVEPNASLRERLASKGLMTKNYMIPYLAEDDSSFDAIVLFHVFEHLNDTREAEAFITEARRVLRTGGLLCILSPDYLHCREDFFNVDYTHGYVTTVRRIVQLFHDNGFRMLRYVYFSGFFSGPMATVASYLVRVGLFFAKGNGIDKKLYKLKTTFLRKFLIVGAKRDR